MNALRSMAGRSALALGLLGWTTLGCDRIHDVLIDAGIVTENTTAPVKDYPGGETGSPTNVPAGPEAAIAKLRLYESCLFSVSRRSRDSRAYYLAWIKDDQAGPTGQEKVVYTAYRLVQVKQCKAAINKARRSLPPMSGLDEVANEYSVHVEALDTSINVVRPYYERKDYKDDGMAKGKAMHAPLMAAFADFMEADDRFRDALKGPLDQAEQEELKRLKDADGPTYQWRKMYRQLKELMAAFDRAGSGKPPPEIGQALAKFTEAVDALASRTKADKKPFAGMRLSKVERCLQSIKEAHRALKAGRKPSTFGVSVASLPYEFYERCEDVAATNNGLDPRRL